MADRQSVPSNVYTVLTIIAMIALLAGVVYLAMRSNDLFGSPNPMDADDLSVLIRTGLGSVLG